MPKTVVWEGVTWTRQYKSVHDKAVRCDGCERKVKKTQTFTSRRHGDADWCEDCVATVESGRP